MHTRLTAKDSRGAPECINSHTLVGSNSSNGTDRDGETHRDKDRQAIRCGVEVYTQAESGRKTNRQL